jgi:hypothetical protein
VRSSTYREGIDRVDSRVTAVGSVRPVESACTHDISVHDQAKRAVVARSRVSAACGERIHDQSAGARWTREGNSAVLCIKSCDEGDVVGTGCRDERPPNDFVRRRRWSDRC